MAGSCEARRDSFMASLWQFQQRGEMCDFTISCRSMEFPVHKLVIAAHSDFFKACCNNGFKETSEKTIDLAEETEQVVKAMIEFMYTCDYHVQPAEDDGEGAGSALALHVLMCIAGDKYNMPDLQHLAVAKFVGVTCSSSQVDPQGMAEAAEIAWLAPGPTIGIQNVVICYAVDRENLYDGNGTNSAFDALMGRLPDLSRRIAREERRRRLGMQEA